VLQRVLVQARLHSLWLSNPKELKLCPEMEIKEEWMIWDHLQLNQYRYFTTTPPPERRMESM
jgi:hypothetical protein